ncbi:bifunctional 3'-5' exonuclease/DNA polymerase [Kocuria sp. HSID16901]|uniref:bifunctional 3'-5' exonuclease/DNA polymerase n=1 Tax=Kocuria sp. HSID16901 TaxID=2419505 RepID=UPI00069E2F3E|nr:bifunctional 3'-5' exonuclease/DNA polymerase [Kocuria sp. HSID16901]RUQ23287.1 bifunctional 3'-5' exonuclease/DNA polymerase [Kocuria sp. HSID16901]
MLIVIGPDSPDHPSDPETATWSAVSFSQGREGNRKSFPFHRLAAFVASVAEHAPEPHRIRWVWSSAHAAYPRILKDGATIARCWDLSLCQAILADAATLPSNELTYSPTIKLTNSQDSAPPGSLPPPRINPDQTSLFEVPTSSSAPPRPTVDDLVTEWKAQQSSLDSSPNRRRLQLLLAAESQGGLIAAEMHHEGLPWDTNRHREILIERLGVEPQEGHRPPLMQDLAESISATLGAEHLNPDSPQDLLRALRAAGVGVSSTRKWSLLEWADHGGQLSQARRELIAPILEYKQLYRLWTANGWHWLREWVSDGRFHPAYVVGGVVTGRWAAHGGGAMQIPQIVRDAVRADNGYRLTVADASQVEPRILAAMSGDQALAVAGRGKDLYRGIAELGQQTGSALKDRPAAKIALLGAMYGATSGEAGALAPHLKRLFPEAISLVERAAVTGQRGGQVTTWLGRTSPAPDESWLTSVRDVSTSAAESRSHSMSRSQGRFTRNFVVQGTAAEWALCWMGEIRRRLRRDGVEGTPLKTSLVFFVHDEVVLHGPESEAADVARIVNESAAAAGRLLFGDAPVDFPLTIATVESYADAK